MLCNAPFLGLTIDPSGWLTLCCNTTDREYFKSNISDIDDLTEFFLSDEYQYIRDKMNSDGMLGIDQCKNCWAAADGFFNEIHNYNKKSFTEPLKIRYLELTTSNVCNQTCVTCSSYFSSKWRSLEPKFDRPVSPASYLKSSSINKILKVLPGLEYLQIKGGEPFADKNNLKILKELASVNPNCEVILTSNFQNINDDWWPILKKLKNISAGASIDGIGESYNWIRGGDFESTLNNMQRFKYETGNQVAINVCVSIYNIFILKQIYDFFVDKSYASCVIFNNIVVYPDMLSPKLLTIGELDIALKKFGNDSNNLLGNIRKMELNHSTMLREKFIKHTNTMNSIRGVNIFDIQPELDFLSK